MYEIIPFKRVGRFEFKANINVYLEGADFVFHPKDDGESWDTYSFGGGILEIHTLDGIIESIACRDDCYFEGQMIIGMDIDEFWSRFEIAKSDVAVEKVFFHDEGEQDVYDVESLGMQLWVGEDKIVTVFVSD